MSPSEILHTLLNEKWNWTWLTVLLTALISSFLLKAALRFLSGILRAASARTSLKWADIGLDLVDGLKFPVLFVWFFFAFSKHLTTTPSTDRLLLTFTVSVSILQVAIWGLHLIRSWRDHFLVKRTANDPSAAAALGLISVGIQGLFLVTIVLIGLSNLGINVGALIAGLGVGGIAVALAAQNILGDLLASLSIILDKPFVIGDFVVSGTEMGTIEHIGVKTTRMRSLTGEQLVLSNKDLLESRLRNNRHLRERRIVQKFGVTYSTPADQIEQIPNWVRAMVGSIALLRFDRCHFAKFGDSSLDFELVFHVLDPDYGVYMENQQKLFLAIMRKFESEGVEFAFPTRTIYFGAEGAN